MHWVLPAAGPVARSASTWLVRWFFDRRATFAFVDPSSARPPTVGVSERSPAAPDAAGTPPRPAALSREEREAQAIAWFWLR
jgi:hypothetical protein